MTFYNGVLLFIAVMSLCCSFDLVEEGKNAACGFIVAILCILASVLLMIMRM